MKYVASSISQMTDYDKYYVYTGHEAGMVTGCWYFWSGTEWLIGGDYQCGIDDIIETSSTMDEEGMPADAKAVGDMIVVSETEPTSPYTELWIDPDTESVLVPTVDDVENTYARKSAIGSPLRAPTASAMTDVTKIYVYTGSETGYTAGNWYYYDGAAWTSGGVYNSTAFVTDTTLTGSGEAADAKVTGDEITDLKSAVGNKSNLNTDTKTNLVSAINEVNGHFLGGIEEGVADWLDNHPEATTTVQDGSLTYKKLVNGTLGYVTPEMFGAKGDGTTDDTSAVQSALDSGLHVIFVNNEYKITQSLEINSDTIIIGNGKFYNYVDAGVSVVKGLFECANAYNISIQDISIESTLSQNTIPYKADINIDESSNIIINNVSINNANGTYGIRCSGCNDVLIYKCKINTFNHTAIANVNSGNNFTVEGCSIFDVNTEDEVTYGIMLNGYETAVTENTPMGQNLKAIGNHIKYTNGWWEAIDAHGGTNVIVKDNVLENVYDGIAVYDDPSRNFKLTNCLIDGNIVICATSGSSLTASFGLNTGGDNIVVSNNIIVNGGKISSTSTAGGMFLQYARNCKIFNNQIYNSKYRAIYVSNANHLVISNNTIKHVSVVSGESYIIYFNNGEYQTTLILDNTFEDAVYSFIFPNVTENAKDAYFKVSGNVIKDVGDGLRMNLCTPDKHITYTQRGLLGDVIINSNPSVGDPIGWICTIESSTENGDAEYKALPDL